ncbi:hypothetical protein EV361DRAFT_956512 [Lentinula raphanica]|nr:hypothetical protein EV361DRAFT_956512 [Lentinula raphanica]
MEEIELTGKEGLVVNAGPSKVEVLLKKSRTEEILEFHPNTLTKVKQSVAIQDVLHNCPENCLTAPESSTHRHTLSSINPSTAPIPWKNLEVYPVKYSNKGYRAIVVDAKQDGKTVSGLSIRIRYETQGMSNSFAWVDYDSLRRVDNDRFLHDDDSLPTIWDIYWRLKPGYSPEYSAEELYSRKRRKLREEDELAGTEPPRATTPFSFSPSTSTDLISNPAWDPSSSNPSSPHPSSSDPPSSDPPSPDPFQQHWILDPRIMEGLRDGLQLLVATNTVPKQDRQVFIRSVNGAIGVYSNIGNRRRKTRETEIVEVDPSTILQNPRSYSVPSNPAIAKGLYIICSGERTGILCRRVSYMVRLDKPRLWLVHAVKLIRKPRRRRGAHFEELLDTDLGTFFVEGTDLATVHETCSMRVSGNRRMDPIRRLHYPLHE